LDPLHGAFSFAKIVMISPSSFLPSLVSGASQKFSVFMFAHLFLALLDNTPHSITSILEEFYSPSPEYPAACCRDEWRGDPPKLEKRRRVGFSEFRFDTPPACGGELHLN